MAVGRGDPPSSLRPRAQPRRSIPPRRRVLPEPSGEASRRTRTFPKRRPSFAPSTTCQMSLPRRCLPPTPLGSPSPPSLELRRMQRRAPDHARLVPPGSEAILRRSSHRTTGHPECQALPQYLTGRRSRGTQMTTGIARRKPSRSGKSPVCLTTLWSPPPSQRTPFQTFPPLPNLPWLELSGRSAGVDRASCRTPSRRAASRPSAHDLPDGIPAPKPLSLDGSWSTSRS